MVGRREGEGCEERQTRGEKELLGRREGEGREERLREGVGGEHFITVYGWES